MLDSPTVRRGCQDVLDALGAARAEIDALNVYPVPDGDTGTNLFLTVESAVEELLADGRDDADVGADLRRAGARRAARCPRQLRRDPQPAAAGSPAGAGPGAGVDAAARGGRAGAVPQRPATARWPQPVEGTMLTVARAAAAAATAASVTAQASGSARAGRRGRRRPRRRSRAPPTCCPPCARPASSTPAGAA